jgi:hypothetical protein
MAMLAESGRMSDKISALLIIKETPYVDKIM